MTIQAFELGINKFINETIPEKIVLMQRSITLQVLSGVVLRSPVASGRFRGNWQVSLEAPVFDVLASGFADASGTIQAGEGVARGIKAFSITYVQNNLPYGPGLEDGNSKQAPAGMVGVTVASVEAQFQ